METAPKKEEREKILVLRAKYGVNIYNDFASLKTSYMNSSMYFEMSTLLMSCFTSGESLMNGISSV